MRNARWKKPKVSSIEIIDERLACFVHQGYTCAAIENIRPFTSLMPMEFAICTGRKPHVHPRHLSSSWKEGCILLACESRTVQTQAIVAEAEWPLRVCDAPCVGPRRCEYVAVESIVATCICVMLIESGEKVEKKTYQGPGLWPRSCQWFPVWAAVSRRG